VAFRPFARIDASGRGAVPASPEAEPGAGRVNRRVRVSRGIASRGDPRFYCEWSNLR